jgi:hypothetical protein
VEGSIKSCGREHWAIYGYDKGSGRRVRRSNDAPGVHELSRRIDLEELALERRLLAWYVVVAVVVAVCVRRLKGSHVFVKFPIVRVLPLLSSVSDLLPIAVAACGLA